MAQSGASGAPAADVVPATNERIRAATSAGCSRWGACPAAGTTAVEAFRPMVCAIRRPSSGEFLVELAGDRDHRHLELTETIPEGSLGSGARASKARGEARRRVAGALVERGRTLVEAGEHRLCEPLAEEALDADRGSAARRRSELVGQLVVGHAAGAALDRIVEAGGTRDEDERGDRLGMGQGRVEAEAGAHRVADVAAAPSRPDQQIGTARRGRRPLRRSRRDREGRPAPAGGPPRGRRPSPPSNGPFG